MGPLGFKYVGPNGRVIRRAAELKRIRSLAIPPAWTDVWICADPRGHLQATGRDARGRKQYRYHNDGRACRDENKFDRMQAFAAALPALRRRTEADLARQGLPREKVLATVVQLLEKSLIRVGNDEYARANRSFGLTTLRNQHVDVKGSTLKFEFRGKSGVRHSVDVNDRRLARIVKQCRDLPGQELFQYIDEDGVHRDVTSQDVNAYLKEISGEDFTAKDFRTWAGTVLAAVALREFEAGQSMTQAKKNVVQAIEAVAGMLGNTRSVCRKSYIHPAIIESYMDGSLLVAALRRKAPASRRLASALRPDEVMALAILQQRSSRDARKRRAA
jgi:DNA topoisomerase-1